MDRSEPLIRDGRVSTLSLPVPATDWNNSEDKRYAVMHIALQGCLKKSPIEYGLTADTGGHIRYLLELVAALSEQPAIERQIIVTRAFDQAELGTAYCEPTEIWNDKVSLWRIPTASPGYLSKEELWRELPSFTQALLDRMGNEKIIPGLIHAHYADAGVVARAIKKKTGVPFIFSAHSLGASKAANLSTPLPKPLRRRIRYEERAIASASALISSSEHEACAQYGLYKQANAEKVVVNPPGCDLRPFQLPVSPASFDEINDLLRPFLRDLDKPCLLAIARPVEKKNLCALVEAFGSNKTLRDRANLVLVAGTRSDLASAEPEAQAVWQKLLYLIDYYDLYGHVAYPKHHTMAQVPALYQWAVQRKGVFVNPALIEPFGLTLLEAAATGLPVVATEEGGPVDIVKHCQHGILIPPKKTEAIASACCRILFDEVAWRRFSAAGQQNVGFYSWMRHAREYSRRLTQLGRLDEDVHDTSLPPVSKCLLATDMDGTLLGCKRGIQRFEHWLKTNPSWLFVIATGRSAACALAQLEKWSAPKPDYIIADVGSSIWRMENNGELKRLEEWTQLISKNWNREACESALAACDYLSFQPESVQSSEKLSFFVDMSRTPKFENGSLDEVVTQRLARLGLKAQVAYSHGRMLDVLPVASGKANAVDFLRKKFGIGAANVYACGDSGNDVDMLSAAANSIVVSNHLPELKTSTLAQLKNIYWARGAHANGILEGINYWSRQLPIPPSLPAASHTKAPARSLFTDENSAMAAGQSCFDQPIEPHAT